MTTPVLDKHERRSATALKLAAHLEQRLAETRAYNDNDMPPEETARVRGQIAELKHLQDLLATGEG
jgi:hypothetical protein